MSLILFGLILQLGNVPAANKREVCNLVNSGDVARNPIGVGSNMKENDVRMQLLEPNA